LGICGECEVSKMSEAKKCAKALLQFIEDCPSVYHVINRIRGELLDAGAVELQETEKWTLLAGQTYFVVRNDASVIAFSCPAKAPKGFHMVAAHSDSPTFKLKANPEMNVEAHYGKLNVEKYGGMIMNTWMDRPLSVAGRVAVTDSQTGKIITRLVNMDKDLLVIPNLAIHMNRDINKGVELNPQVDMLPLFGEKAEKGVFNKRIAKQLGIKPEEILDWDFFLYAREKGRFIGDKEEFILSPKLDDLQCVFCAKEAFLHQSPAEYINVFAVFDHEEIGSTSRQAADSDFLKSVLERIVQGLEGQEKSYEMLLADSYLLSADNAHAVHPNHPEKADPTNRPYLNQGVVLKYHGGQKYTSDGVSGAYFKLLCKEAKVPYQTFANRADMTGGSTLGNISTAHVSVMSADIGMPQLAMHSCVETGGVKDTLYGILLMKKLYEK